MGALAEGSGKPAKPALGWRALKALSDHLTISIPSMMVLGFAYGFFLDPSWLKKLIIPFTFLMVYPMMVNLKIKKVFEGGDGKTQLFTQLVNFGVVPFVCYAVGLIFFKDQPYLALGLLLAGLVPTSGMTISYTGFAKGNMAAAVKMTVVGLTLGSLVTPFYIKFLLGATIEVDLLKVFMQIVIVVFLPMLAGYLTQSFFIARLGQEGFKKTISPRMPGLSTLGVLSIVFVAMGLKAKSIADEPQMLLMILIPLALIYLFNYALSTIIGKLFMSRENAIAMVFGSVMRNLSIALAIAINALGEKGSSAALVVAIAYIIQVQSAAWYIKYADRIFGPPSASGGA